MIDPRRRGGVDDRQPLGQGLEQPAITAMQAPVDAAVFVAVMVLDRYAFELGGSADRARLAAPVDDRLFFAGEACSLNFFSTAHGAYETGTAAAEAALASLR